MKSLIYVVAFISLFTVSQSQAMTPITFDFDDGLQGWNPWLPFNGDLMYMANSGHPGGCLAVQDTLSGGGYLSVQAPAFANACLSEVTNISWDEYVYSADGSYMRSTSLSIFGTDGTRWRTYRTTGPLDQWVTLSTTMDESDWYLDSGTQSFAEVVANGILALNLECNVGTPPSLEARIDNIVLLPEPGSLAILGFGLLFACKRR